LLANKKPDFPLEAGTLGKSGPKQCLNNTHSPLFLQDRPIAVYHQPAESEIKKALEILNGPDSPVELRAIHKNRNRIDAGVFDHEHRQELVDAAIRLNKMGAAVYVTLNPIDPQLLSRYHNRIQESAKATATDANITRWRWLLVDIDPIRPKDTAATDEQLDQAKGTAREIYKHLNFLGWHDPVVAESGNDMHLFYRVDLPNDDASRDLIKGVLNKLADQFDNKVISIDRSVFNAARIVKLHGTLATKGDNTTLSPWRLSKIVKDQDSLSVVSAEQLHFSYDVIFNNGANCLNINIFGVLGGKNNCFNAHRDITTITNCNLAFCVWP
jgi:hypothetical protein